jgi:hypothetical protein
MQRIFSPPTGGYPQEVPDYWRFADGTIRRDLQSLSDAALNDLEWTGPITIPVAKKVDNEGNITNEGEYTYDGVTHKIVWYEKERTFVIIGKEESELPYLSNAPKPDVKWSEFKKQAVASVSLNTFVGELMSIAPVAATALPVAILALETGNFSDFMNVWSVINNVVEVPTELIAEFTTLAIACNLPQEFITIFSVT